MDSGSKVTKTILRELRSTRGNASVRVSGDLVTLTVGSSTVELTLSDYRDPGKREAAIKGMRLWRKSRINLDHCIEKINQKF